MKVSLRTIKKYIDIELPPVNELVAKINAQLGGVEEVIDVGAIYKDAKIVKVVECDKHPDADKLSVCKVDAGKGELVQVVCGAPNARAGMWAVWLPPGATVPSTHNDAEPFVLDARKLRGVMSHGMLAAGDELAINNDHEGIIEITGADLPEGAVLQEGASFATTFGLDDTVIDIENKMFTHRPDLFGQLGVAREISAILHGVTSTDEGRIDTAYKNPNWYQQAPEFTSASDVPLEVFNDAEQQVPRIMFTAMKGVQVQPSPLWLQCALVVMGVKPVNNIVDATNYVMLLTAQPTHAYDYDKLRGGRIGARMARAGEKVALLNGKEYELTQEDIVIADGEGPVGIAGVMGGVDSEVSESTATIVLEVATFDMYAVRKSSMRYGLFTDAVTRFNKGQSPLQNACVMNFLTNTIKQVSSGQLASEVYDLSTDSLQRSASLSGEIAVHIDFINSRLGTSLTVSQVANLLGRTNFNSRVDDDNDTLYILAPFWRTDILLPEDIVEEVGRLYGFDALPRTLPLRSTKAAPKNTMRLVKQKLRSRLSRAGANEVLTYSFVHENILKKAEQDESQAFRLGNALSPDLQYYRLTVLPSLLDKVHMNSKAGHEAFTLFEIGKGHNKKYHLDDDNGLPKEMQFVDAVYASKQAREGAPYYYMRRLVTQLALDHGYTLRFKAIDTPIDYPVTSPFDLSRSALVEADEGVFIGMIGELKQSVIRDFKLPQYVAAMTLDLEELHEAIVKPRSTYQPLSRYPSTSRDVSIAVSADVPYDSVYGAAKAFAGTLAESMTIEPIGIYQPEESVTKNITLRVTILSYERTLSGKDITSAMDRFTQTVCQAVDGSVV